VRATLVVAVMVMGCSSAKTETAGAAGDWSCGAIHGEPRMARRLGGGGRLVLGAVADTNGAAPTTMANLQRFCGVFRQEHVDAVAALGDLGGTEDEIARVLTALGAAGAPVLALAGERESESAFHAAVGRARAAGVDVVDLVDKRIVDTGEMDIVSAPGYPFSKDGCRYRPSDLQELARALGAPMRPVVLLAHTPPKGDGAAAIDRAVGDVNAGDPAMLDLVNAIYPNAALFAHVDEAGGRASPRGWINVGGVESGAAMMVTIAHGIAHTRVLR
jgi:Icc-related predicted phosphoesterase